MSRAIAALHSEVGDTSEYKGLIDSMKSAIGSGDGEDTHRAGPERDTEKDDYSFETATQRHKEKLNTERASEAKAEAEKAGAAAAGGEDK